LGLEVSGDGDSREAVEGVEGLGILEMEWYERVHGMF